MASIHESSSQPPTVSNSVQETNNKLANIAEASGYASVNEWKQPHDWCGYNFHKPDWGVSDHVDGEERGAGPELTICKKMEWMIPYGVGDLQAKSVPVQAKLTPMLH